MSVDYTNSATSDEIQNNTNTLNWGGRVFTKHRGRKRGESRLNSQITNPEPLPMVGLPPFVLSS